MATVTATRGTPNFTIAPAQNTAPVYEFSCLYSHDLRKKKKTWHDGSLRFHSFNKRVMVYDESKNYIGDSHWREDEDLQEGTELKLDKGVLVDVGERIGRTETDLNPLLEKRRLKPGSSPARAPLRPITLSSASRTNGNQIQRRPKPLSAVLGASQGPIGRARLPTKSPYEQRQDTVPVPSRPMEPPTKRARLEATVVETMPQMVLPTNTGSRRLARSASISTTDRQPPMEVPKPGEVMDISSESTPTPLRSSSPPVAEAQDAFKQRSKLPQPKATPVEAPKQLVKQQPERMLHSAGHAAKSSLKPATSSAVVGCSRGTSSASSNKLRLALHKPRRKLMYKVLLDGSKQSAVQRSTSGASIKERLNSEPRAQATRSKGSRTLRGLSYEAEDSPTKTSKTSDRVRNVTRGGGLSDAFTPSSSPLLIPESPNKAIDKSSTSKHSGTGGCLPPSPLMPQASTKLQTRFAEVLSKPVTDFSQLQDNDARAFPPLGVSTLTVIDQQLLAKPLQAIVSRSTLLAKNLRRVVSESDSPSYRTDLRAPAAAAGSHTLPESTFMAARKAFASPPRLSRSHSESEAIPMTAAVPPLEPVPEMIEQNLGAWSKVEAFLLFDWHPPDRERLVISDRERINEHNRFGSTRGVLSDQIDAL